VIVNVSVVEGERKRVQAYEGVVIAKRNRGLNSSFVVRKISSGEGVERTFQTYSPMIASIEVKRRATSVAPSCITCAIAPGSPRASAKSSRTCIGRSSNRKLLAGQSGRTESGQPERLPVSLFTAQRSRAAELDGIRTCFRNAPEGSALA
jgi:hypothetical protein